MQRSGTIASAVLLLLVLASASAAAGVVFDSGAPNGSGANELTYYLQANVFQLAQAATVRSAGFVTVETGTWDGTLEWAVFPEVSALPSTSALASGSSAYTLKSTYSVDMFAGFAEYEYLFNLDTPVNLQADTRYWFALHLAQDYSSAVGIYWQTAPVGLGNGSHAEATQGNLGTWSIWGNEHSFRLDDALVPEPAALLLFGAGVAGLALYRLRRRKRAA